MKKPTSIKLKWISDPKKLPVPNAFPSENHLVICRRKRDGKEWVDIAQFHKSSIIKYWKLIGDRDINIQIDSECGKYIDTDEVISWAKIKLGKSYYNLDN